MSKKVLIIEDRRENIVFIANKILKPEGWEVITARDGELGLQKAIEEQPDLIITDLKLPKMHGLDVLEELNNRGFRIPTIVMTFHGSEQTAIRAFRLGAADYLVKPFQIEEITTAIERALRSRGGHGSPAPSVDASVTETLARQEQEIRRLRSLLSQHEKALQEREQLGLHTQAPAADVARWRALLREKDATLTKLKTQTIAQHQAMTRQISNLRAQLAEKEAILISLQNQDPNAASRTNVQSGRGELSTQLAEKEKALAQADKLVRALTRTVAAQQKAIEKHRAEAERLAREMHLLATGVQVMGQNLSDQASQVPSVLPGQE
jgi:DNA-binding response OmpR family regulator